MKHLMHNPPTRLPRSIRNNPVDSEIGRIIRALERLKCKECLCCHEIHPSDTMFILGLCKECFLYREEGIENINPDEIPLQEISRLWHLWNKAVHSQLAGETLSPYRPVELDLLLILWDLFGEERMNEAMQSKGAKSYLPPSILVFVHSVGLIPKTETDGVFAKTRNHWRAIIRNYFVPLARTTH